MEPILIDVPTEIETERLILRKPEVGDGKVVNEAIRASITELKPYLAFAQEFPPLEETEKNLREASANFILRKDLRFLIFHKDGSFIGTTGLHDPHWSVPKFEIGYWADSRQTGNGYMTEAIKGLTDFALRLVGAQRLEILIHMGNDKSRKVAERAGYDLEGVLKNEDRLPDGRLSDSYLFVKTPGDEDQIK